MSNLPGIPMDRNPHLIEAAGHLSVLLGDYGYSPHARDAIVRYTVANGTPTGAPGLDPEDEADASMVFEEALPAIDRDDPAWGPAAPPVAGGAEEFVPSEEDWADYRRWCEQVDARAAQEAARRPEKLYGYE